MIEVSIDSEELRHAQKLFADMPKKLNNIISKGTRRLREVLTSELSNQISREYYVKRGDVKSRMSAELTRESVTVRVRDKRHTLKSFLMRPKKAPIRRKAAGYLTGAVRRGNMHRFSRGFVFPVNDLPVMRIGKGKHRTFEGLKIITGPSIAQLADNRTVLPEVIEKAQAQMLQQIRYWTQREMQLSLF